MNTMLPQSAFMSSEPNQRHRLEDSGAGAVIRPFANGVPGGRVATLETLYDFFIDQVEDPDAALRQDPNFGEKLRTHPDVHAAMRHRELTVASMPDRIIPATCAGHEELDAKTAAQYVSGVFNRLPNKQQMYLTMENAVLMGGQGIEFPWAQREGAMQPIRWYPVNKQRFTFDRAGNMALLTREAPVWGEYVERAPDLDRDGQKALFAPQGRFIYHKYMSTGGTWTKPQDEGYIFWGKGEDVALYMPVTFDLFVNRLRIKFLERYGNPLAVLKYPTTDPNALTVMRNIALSVKNDMMAAIPARAGDASNSWYDLTFIQPPSTANDLFAGYSDWIRTKIDKILLGGANLLQLGENGSYGATVNQRDASTDMIFRYDAHNISETLNQQLIPAIVRQKWPNFPENLMPKHSMEHAAQENRMLELQVLGLMAQSVPTRKSDWYTKAGIQPPSEEELANPDAIVFMGASPTTLGQGDLIPGGIPQNSPGQPPSQPGQPLGAPGTPPGQPGQPTGLPASLTGRPRTPIGSFPAPIGGSNGFPQ